MIKVLIIEDEPYAQDELKRLLQNSNFELDVIDCIESVEDAVMFFENNAQPDLIFFDIQLSDGISFDIFERVKITAPVIFTTAYDEYAIQAFKVNSIDYLLKPIEQEALNTSLNKLVEFKNHFSNKESVLSLQQIQSIIELAKPQQEYKSRIIIKVGDQIKFVSVNQIAYFYAEGNEVFVMTSDKHRYIVDFTLDQLGKLLNPILFHRLNRSILAHAISIVKIHKYFNSRLKVELNPAKEEEILISRVRVPEFLQWMEK
ncbi:MAG: LytTR family DNA-binding domain-containing protein [Salinivirgaceae bacterium]|jgi:two-component system response regulator LytT|nr:LytTR family DNA-binding domain-containing protein [Salinivirgaceae bacterium]